MYITSKYVAQTYVYGDSLKAALVAIVVPDEEVVLKWAKDNRKTETFEDLCQTQVREEGGRAGFGLQVVT